MVIIWILYILDLIKYWNWTIVGLKISSAIFLSYNIHIICTLFAN